MQNVRSYTPATAGTTNPVRRVSPRRLLRALFLFGVKLYALAALAYFALRWLVGERSIDGEGSYWLRLIGGFVGAGNSFMPAWLLPLLLLALPALLLRGWLTVVLTLPTLVALGVLYGEMLLPGSYQPVGMVTGPEFTLVTYNLHADSRPAVLERQAGVIRTLNADVVLLQELSEGAVDFYEREFADEYPYRALFPYTNEPVSGGGILSRYPVENAETWRNTMGHVRAEVLIGGVRVQMFSIHPMIPSLTPWAFSNRVRDREIADVLERAEQLDRTLPFVLAGDFNLNDQSPMYRVVDARYTDVVRRVGVGLSPTFPNASAWNTPLPSFINFPLARIDYVFINHWLHPLEARTHWDSGGSDHFPVYTRLTVTDPTASPG